MVPRERPLLKRLNPFARLPNPRAVWAWGMYDLANQSFQLLINTLLFAVFVQNVVFADPASGKRGWSYMVAASMILVIVLSPVLGAMADQRAWKRELLLTTGFVCAALTVGLAVLQPGWVWVAAALYVVAALACGLGENFLGSFLPEISTPANVGFVSALGWTMSYVGALMLLGITAIFAFVLGRDDVSQMRPMFVLAGLWFLAGMAPALLFLREKATPRPSARGVPVVLGALRRLLASAAQTARFRHLFRFLLIFFVYSMGTKIVIVFLGIIGDRMGFGLKQLVLFALLLALTAGVASALAARFQDRFGHRRTIRVFLALWALATASLATAHQVGAPAWMTWGIAGAIGLGLGGIGTSSRAMVGLFTPEHRAAEFFGVWGTIDKLALVVGALLFGAVPMGAGLYMVSGFFVAGLVLMGLVDERGGARAAAESIANHDHRTPRPA
ncbi:MAG: MFS transporter [Phycisphaerae bacterium]|nr:MFS transporter [Phycisphaerae bacterium]